MCTANFRNVNEVIGSLDINYQKDNDYYISQNGYYFSLSFRDNGRYHITSLCHEFTFNRYKYAYSLPQTPYFDKENNNYAEYSDNCMGIDNFAKLKNFYKELATARIFDDRIEIDAYNLDENSYDNVYVRLTDENGKILVTYLEKE